MRQKYKGAFFAINTNLHPVNANFTFGLICLQKGICITKVS